MANYLVYQNGLKIMKMLFIKILKDITVLIVLMQNISKDLCKNILHKYIKKLNHINVPTAASDLEMLDLINTTTQDVAPIHCRGFMGTKVISPLSKLLYDPMT